jgi:tetratricopeptide (TPR) repeat protein
MKDSLGLQLSGATAASLPHYDQALQLLQCYLNDPVAASDLALAESPGFVMAHVLKAWLHLLGTEPGGLPVARACHEAARLLPQTPRERGHLKAIGNLLEGRWYAASRVLEDVAIEHPRDILALQVGHQLDFFTGESRMLRDRIARALPGWDKSMPGYHAMLSMHAFGLEETGDYTRAEASGRKAIELQPRDAWAQHAVAHVMEMQGRQKDGIAWMRANPDAWSTDSFFKVHNWWHLALYHLDLDEIDEVLALYDGPIYGERSGVALDMVDASALLWRLHLRGINVGNRWAAVADNWAPQAANSIYAFNDAHAMMAFVGAGRGEAAGELIAHQRRTMRDGGDNAIFTREVGHAVTTAIAAFGAGSYSEVVRLLRQVRNVAHRFGGSHAQRDLIDLTLIEAAFRAGQRSLATALAGERIQAKPSSPLAQHFAARTRSTCAAAA